ncbi:hypothetical protein ACFB49_36580 [Sphingomonas sp. DBB INV C78]|uniref:SGNH/GDSL hydrolase family protein n=1 Tax=Sphingomonas sp. DBB INV C78 TaxID=3349434 RepID=UPI0036D39DDA
MIKRVLIAVLSLAIATSPAGAARDPKWIGSWAAAQQIPDERNALDAADMRDVTLRQTVRLSAGGDRIRLRLSNSFGTAPLRFSRVYVALGEAGSARIDTASGRPVTFSGRTEVTVPAGATYLSDPVALKAGPLASVTVSFHLPEAPAQQSAHTASIATSFIARGNQVDAADLPGAKQVDRWYQLAGVDVEADRGAAIVALGDSITDGIGATNDANNRWPDVLAERLQASVRTGHLAVLNQGISGNRLLADGTGPNALARLDRDVLAQPGVRYLIVLEGVNDLGNLSRDGNATPEVRADRVHRMIAAYGQIIERARARGIRVIGATILPYGAFAYYRPDAAAEADRQTINRWIRAKGNFDAVVDFDAVVRDPNKPDRLRADYDSGDGIHPSAAGYRAMGEAIPVTLFKD